MRSTQSGFREQFPPSQRHKGGTGNVTSRNGGVAQYGFMHPTTPSSSRAQSDCALVPVSPKATRQARRTPSPLRSAGPDFAALIHDPSDSSVHTHPFGRWIAAARCWAQLPTRMPAPFASANDTSLFASPKRCKFTLNTLGSLTTVIVPFPPNLLWVNIRTAFHRHSRLLGILKRKKKKGGKEKL